MVEAAEDGAAREDVEYDENSTGEWSTLYGGLDGTGMDDGFDSVNGIVGMDLEICANLASISYPLHELTRNSHFPSTSVKVMRLSDALSLSTRWKELLPTLVDSILVYHNKSVSTFDPLPLQFTCRCSTGVCNPRQSKLQCYTLSSYRDIVVPHCECISLPQALIQQGLFPASPSRPWTAFSIDLLDMYHRLWQCSSDAITSFSSCLVAIYKHRGFSLYSEMGSEQQDPVRRPLGQAIQWYDCLVGMVECQVFSIIDACISEGLSSHSPTTRRSDSTASESINPQAAIVMTTTPGSTPSEPSDLRAAVNNTPGLSDESVKVKVECTAMLQHLCPCCFGGHDFGRSFDE
ncbi:hypothetical protein E1B28_013080 [Marasmius oreades]|uniref:CxC1-like cysteine cluster associated with KDZ transposases domain-containing protein n=1 Tax=Marasmius oreades TaxID=181124 RepID=A0A9P7RP09_9AGAR|nr:uncharacterized protein E1B28_013080 [Marasmius oreades]KAG7087099.1 hypothetical protein E1B28_013080 [Marasmius oreades]